MSYETEEEFEFESQNCRIYTVRGISYWDVDEGQDGGYTDPSWPPSAACYKFEIEYVRWSSYSGKYTFEIDYDDYQLKARFFDMIKKLEEEIKKNWISCFDELNFDKEEDYE